jgi:hypothetical protein
MQHRAADAALPEQWIDDKLGARAFDLVGDVEVAVSDDPVIDERQDRFDRFVTAIAQVQRDVLGQRPNLIDLGCPVDKVLYLAGLPWVEPTGRDDLDLRV